MSYTPVNIVPYQLNTPTNNCTHNIASVVPGDIQSSSADLVTKNYIEDDHKGYDFLELYFYVVAPGSDTTPLVTLYKEFDNGEFANQAKAVVTTNEKTIWTKGLTLPTTPITVASGQTLVPTFVEVVYVGSGRIGIALSQCTTGTRIVIAARRVPGNYVPR